MDDKLTIVGPEPTQPRDVGRSRKLNIEAVLLTAKYDPSFRARLLADRDKALEESGLNLSPGEKLLLGSISDEQLAQNIREFRAPGISSKSLSKWTAAAALLLLLSSLSLANLRCDSSFEPAPVTGSAPDTTQVHPPIDGITPDSTEVDPDSVDIDICTGSVPDPIPDPIGGSEPD